MILTAPGVVLIMNDLFNQFVTNTALAPRERPLDPLALVGSPDRTEVASLDVLFSLAGHHTISPRLTRSSCHDVDAIIASCCICSLFPVD
jgi:hypothetical protein